VLPHPPRLGAQFSLVAVVPPPPHDLHAVLV